MRLYSTLTPWYTLIDPTRDHEEEANAYADALQQTASPPVATLLELGSGAGNNAFFLKRRFGCTLVDPSPEMRELCRRLNPECELIDGDMRTIRLGRQFDAVLVHDAVMYMTSRDDLRAMAETALAHTRPGGAAVFAPDYVKDTFTERTNLIQENAGPRALRGVEWAWDPDPSDDTFRVDYALVLRDGDTTRVEHDQHVEGLFSRETWRRVLTSAGYAVQSMLRSEEGGASEEVFVCKRL